MQIITELAGNLQNPAYELILNPDTLKSLMEDGYAHAASVGVLPEDVTGALVKVGDGEYEMIWVTESPSPYLITAEYTRVL